MVNRKIGQITVKRVGNKWAACISGTPEELYNSFKLAEKKVNEMRDEHGRRHCGYNGNKKKKCNKHK